MAWLGSTDVQLNGTNGRCVMALLVGLKAFIIFLPILNATSASDTCNQN